MSTMSTPPCHARINYIEMKVADIARAKAFYGQAFGWTFTDYGPSYTEFTDGAFKGGFTNTEPPRPGGVLVVLYADNLPAIQGRILSAGGEIVRPVFPFPGGERFHFADPDGHELAVWTAA